MSKSESLSQKWLGNSGVFRSFWRPAKDAEVLSRTRPGPRPLRKALNVIKKDTITFCETTTVHGLRLVVASQHHIVEKLFWATCVLVVSRVCWSLGVTQVHRFTHSATMVSVDKDHRSWRTAFPAITACFGDRVNMSLADDFIRKTWNVSYDNPEKMEYYRSYIILVASVSFRSNLRSFWRFERDPSFANVDLMEVAASVIPEISPKTVLHEKGRKIRWEPVITEMGMCRTFNSVFSRYQSVSTWRLQLQNSSQFSSNEGDLLTCHHMDRQCAANITIASTTAKYYIHSPYEIAESTSNPIVELEEGSQLVVEFRVVQIKADPAVRALGLEQRGCRFPEEPISATIPAYSNALCQMECRTRLAEVFCGCRPFYYIIGDGKPCDTIGMGCLGRQSELLMNLPVNLVKCRCVPQCTELNYIPHDQQLSLRNLSEPSLIAPTASFSFSLQMPKLLLRKNVIFTFEDLVASLGGLGALCLGISFMSLVEALLFLWRLLMQLLEGLSSRAAVQTIS